MSNKSCRDPLFIYPVARLPPELIKCLRCAVVQKTSKPFQGNERHSFQSPIEGDKGSKEMDRLYISVVTYTELIYGVEHSSSKEINRPIGDDFVRHLTIIAWDKAVAEHYLRLKTGHNEALARELPLFG